jgi:hypothetical protein
MCPTATPDKPPENLPLEQPGSVQLAEEGRDATSPVHVLHVVVRAGRDLGQAGHPAGYCVDVGHGQVYLGSARQFIEFAVNIPEHEPQVGHAERSTTVSPLSSTSDEADAEIAVIKSVGAWATPSTTTV